MPNAKVASIEPTAEAEDGWTGTCNEIADMTLFPKADSWIFGANIPGKKNAVMFFMGGCPTTVPLSVTSSPVTSRASASPGPRPRR